MKAELVKDITETDIVGAVEIRHLPAAAGDEMGQIAGLAIKCPGCGSESWLPLREAGKTHPSNPCWTLTALYPLSIEPSVFHKKENGGCGWHGYLREGEWKSC